MSHLRLTFLWFLTLAPAWIAGASADSPSDPLPEVLSPGERELVFEKDIRPLLKHHCFHCHGEEEELSGSLDTRLVHLMVTGGDSGAAIVPGDHKASELFLKIESKEMPPGGVSSLSEEELQRIAQWIDQGAKTLRPEPESIKDDDFTEEERSHWAFQPILRPSLPDNVGTLPPRGPGVSPGTALATSGETPGPHDASGPHEAPGPQTPIDLFIAAKLAEHQLALSPEADRTTLIRRVTFDLIGLPPTPERIDQFLADTRPDAYERLVDELLDSPLYGERWGRHWLDVAGYADSDGYSAKDLERKWAWKYRDYVIRAFNEDKPWNEFIVEQLAGDELLTPPYENLTEEQTEKLIATGFLRMGPDGTGDGEVEQDVARNEVMAETIKIVSTSFLGLTVGCAQCHTHRYDPITHVDYHRIRSVFEPAYDWKSWKAPNARLISQWSAETRQLAAEVDAELKKIQTERTAELDALVVKTLEEELAKLPAERQEAARLAKDTPADKRTEEQQQLIKEYPFLNVSRGSVYLYLPDQLRGFNKQWDDRAAAVRARRPAEDWIHCLTEVPGQAPLAKRFARGDYQNPQEDIPPGDLSILLSTEPIPSDDEALPTSGRRLAYARGLVSGEHPLVARVLVNRFWMHHFGRGLVPTVGDFGMLGERPSHPELLDWLASEFMENGWHLKPLHRQMVTSATYRQSSFRRDELEGVDPENRLLGRMNVRRLESEVIRDSLLAVVGQISSKRWGPPVPVTVDDTGQAIIGVDTRDGAGRPTKAVASLGEEEMRRSIYIAARRTLPLGMLEPFDAPLMTPNCEQRPVSTVAPQSLLLMNNAFVVAQVETLAKQLLQSVGDDQEKLVATVWRRCFGRSPNADELSGAIEFLKAQRGELEANPPTGLPKGASTDPNTLALTALCHALVSSNAFLYVD